MPAEQAWFGEVIEDRATYKNTGKQAVKDLMATLPIPRPSENPDRERRPGQIGGSIFRYVC